MEQCIMLIVIVVVFGGMMWWQSKKAKQQQQEKQDFRRNLQPGTEVITIGQVIGKVVEVDEQYEEIVIDSEHGNPLPDEDTEAPANDEAGQVPIEASVVSEEDTADETGDDNETKTK